MSDFLNKRNPNATFVVKNLATRTIKIFNSKIGSGNSVDLMKIPGITENIIKESLLKGTLYNKISAGEVQITSSDINLLTTNPTQKLFLSNNNIPSLSTTRTDYASQTVWYIDPTLGVDTNTGLTSGTAIKTWTELTKRIGTSPVISAPTNIYLLGDLPVSDPLILKNPTLLMAGYLYVHGTLTAVTGGSGTYTSATSRVAATNTPCQVTDTARSSWTANVGQLIKNTAGTAGSIDAFAWVLKDLTGNAARLTPLAKTDNTASFTHAIEVNPTVSDSYQLYTLSSVADFFIEVKANSFFPSPVGLTGRVIFENIKFANTSIERCHIIGNSAAALRFAGCLFSGSFNSISGAAQLTNCLWTASFGINGGQINYVGVNINAGGGTATLTCSLGAQLTLRAGVTIQSTAVPLAVSVNSFVRIVDAGLFDWSTSPNSGLQIFSNGVVQLGDYATPGKLWGVSASASSFGVHIINGKFIVPDATLITIVGSLTATKDFQIASASSGPAMDLANAATAPFTAARNYTWVNLRATVAASGFGGNCINPASGTGIVIESI